MRNLLILTLFGAMLYACGNSEEKTEKDAKPTKEYLKAQIKEINDSLQVLYAKVMNETNFEFPELAINEAIFRQLEFYKYYPEDDFSAECLDKTQQLFMQDKAYEMALQYTDTLLVKYPKYNKRANLLLNAGSTGEIMQDTTVIRKYYSQLLKEFPNLDKETKEMVQFRLANLDLTFDQLIDLQIKKTAKK